MLLCLQATSLQAIFGWLVLVGVGYKKIVQSGITADYVPARGLYFCLQSGKDVLNRTPF